MEECKYLKKKWGKYRLNFFLKSLLVFKYLGLSRGGLRHIILNIIIKCHPFLYVDYNYLGCKFRLSIKNNNTDAKILTTSKDYEKDELEFLCKFLKGNYFLDIGANTGYYSLLIAKKIKNCQILAIEPNPKTYRILEFNISANNLDSRIKIERSGIGENEVSTFHSSGDLGSVSLFKSDDGQYESFSLKTQTLEETIQKHNITKIDAIKIDIEGMENIALQQFFEVIRLISNYFSIYQNTH